jgi:hypothetical protein
VLYLFVLYATVLMLLCLDSELKFINYQLWLLYLLIIFEIILSQYVEQILSSLLSNFTGRPLTSKVDV